MKIAVEGCAHGDLDNIYATLQHLERVEQTKIDLLVCCGDFQAMRNQNDLLSMACPEKYRTMNSFWKYYCGQKTAPYPTVFVGGNHEASSYLWELYYGGWAAKNIYFLGLAGVVNFGGVRIGGLSGIYKSHDYPSGHYERAPYNDEDMRSVYHTRAYDVLKLLKVEEVLDVFISHDWPRGITKFGNARQLLQKKPFLRGDVESNTLGSVPAEEILHKLKPAYWFAAHHHTKFPALVPHPDGSCTRFLALDKCLPRRQFLQVVDFPAAQGPLEFTFDNEWLAITRAFDPYFPLSRHAFSKDITKEELSTHREWVNRTLLEKGEVIPVKFEMTAAPYNPTQITHSRESLNVHYRNPFTKDLLELLGLPYRLDTAPEPRGFSGKNFSQPGSGMDPNEIQLADEDDMDAPEAALRSKPGDPNEISLNDSGSDDVSQGHPRC